jgi:uncharacterized protein YydD (DUF2326 family)
MSILYGEPYTERVERFKSLALALAETESRLNEISSQQFALSNEATNRKAQLDAIRSNLASLALTLGLKTHTSVQVGEHVVTVSPKGHASVSEFLA